MTLPGQAGFAKVAEVPTTEKTALAFHILLILKDNRDTTAEKKQMILP